MSVHCSTPRSSFSSRCSDQIRSGVRTFKLNYCGGLRHYHGDSIVTVTTSLNTLSSFNVSSILSTRMVRRVVLRNFFGTLLKFTLTVLVLYVAAATASIVQRGGRPRTWSKLAVAVHLSSVSKPMPDNSCIQKLKMWLSLSLKFVVTSGYKLPRLAACVCHLSAKVVDWCFTELALWRKIDTNFVLAISSYVQVHS